LITPEWSAWKPIMHLPSWRHLGHQRLSKRKGASLWKGDCGSDACPDEFTTKIELHYASGQVETRTGKGVVYTGYSWRGRSKAAQTGSATDPNYSPVKLASNARLARRSTMEGRWFWGGYQEFGLDVQLIRQGSETVVTGTDRYSVPSPWTGEIHIYGGNLPSMPKPPTSILA